MSHMSASSCEAPRSRRQRWAAHVLLALTVGVAGFAISATGQTPSSPAPALTQRFDASPQFSIGYPAGWSVRRVGNIQQMLAATAADLASGKVDLEEIASVVIHTEQRADQAEALLRLRQIAAESDAPSQFLEIAGWPALQRQQVVRKPDPGDEENFHYEHPDEIVMTTAIAADTMIIRLEAVLPSNATPTTLAEAGAVVGSVITTTIADPTATQKQLDDLRAAPPLGPPSVAPQSSQSLTPLDSPPPEAEFAAIAPAPLRLTRQNGIDSELEISVSTNGRDIVVGSNSSYFYSNDGGQTFNTVMGVGPNDPSLAYGASGAFYAGNIGGVCNTSIARSTNNGQTFTATTSAYTCPNAVPMPGPNGCVQDAQCGGGFPDQEHIAADRYNPAPGGDQVYSTWRSLWNNVGIGIVCSQDNGTTWTNAIFTLGDFPRIAVGQNGRVYVVYRNQNNIMLWSLSSCATGLVPSAPVMVVTTNPQVPCPVPGLNRCNDGNNLSSPTVAVDDSNANHVFVSYAVNTGANNEDVLLQDSVDAGANWGSCRSTCGVPLPGDSLIPCTPGGAACPVAGESCCPNTVQVSSGILGRRFMPWTCSVGGKAYVTWYDRRNATPGDNSLTDYFSGSAERDGFALVPGNETQYTPVQDSQCGPPNTAWAGSAPRSNNDSESCSQQPQLAGQCATGTCMSVCGMPMAGDSLNACNPGGPACPGGEMCCVTANPTRCDFSDCGTTACNMTATGQAACQCPMNQFCVCGGGSPPRYGDYNGSACMAGRLYATWASAASPPAITPASSSIDIFFSSSVVCCVPQIQVPSYLDFGLLCSGSGDTRELDVCNTGKEDLSVDSITSSTFTLSVAPPSAGYPVTISPDACFPFQVTYAPHTAGSATLTIASSDSVNPIETVNVYAAVGAPDIATTIANSGSFGNVCVGDFRDIDITVNNGGTCPLVVSNVVSGSAEFIPPSVTTYPLTIGAGDSTAIPIRYEPSGFGADTANVTILSNDPNTPLSMVAVSGNAPPGEVRVTGSGDFGDVCAGDLAEKTINVCNVGGCDLAGISASIDCSDFTIINNPFPATVSPDFCMNLVIRFTPTSAGPKSCTLTITTDDPNHPVVTVPLTANTPLPMIDVPPDQGFPPTVVQTTGACTTALPFPVSNTGTCPLKITGFAISSNPAEYSLLGLPSFPILLEQGHIAGDGDLDTVFAPGSLDRAREGKVSVTYVSEPILGTTTTVDRNLCGEGVQTGARVLVTRGGVPLATVKRIQLHRINANRNKVQLDSVDNVRDVPLTTVPAAPPCGAFQYHREYGTVSNPIQLAPGSYQVSVQARIDGKIRSKVVGFDVSTCDFNPTVVVDF
ncbi:MAG TPA: choice-of-anchor D domain-containing protein [Candidatus Saccharimonadales bacterium]|nr:choice-of-anchor D domain-containing protein [Candidatus Saccharimonadales bacterium]